MTLTPRCSDLEVFFAFGLRIYFLSTISLSFSSQISSTLESPLPKCTTCSRKTSTISSSVPSPLEWLSLRWWLKSWQLERHSTVPGNELRINKMYLPFSSSAPLQCLLLPLSPSLTSVRSENFSDDCVAYSRVETSSVNLYNCQIQPWLPGWCWSKCFY